MTPAGWASLFALLSALGFGVAGIFLKRGLQHVTPLTAAVVSVSFTTAFMWLLAAATEPLSLLLSPRVVPFLVAGLIAPGLARLVYFVGVDRVGVARGAALTATAPLFAVAIAMLVLGERPAALALVGAAAIVAGGVRLAHRPREDRSWRRRDMVFPLLAALGFAARDNVSRWGFRDFAHPVLAAAAATLSSLIVMWLVAAVRRGSVRLRLDVGLGYLALSGVAEGFAYVMMWRALAVGDVSLVSPLINAYPIFILALAALFLRDLERVTWRIVLAVVLIIAGVVAVVRSVGV